MKEKKDEVQNVLGAINKRDKGMIQLDDSKMTDEGDGQALTKEQATEYLKESDTDYIRAEEMRGNLEPLNKMNAALKRLGAEPIPILIKT